MKDHGGWASRVILLAAAVGVPAAAVTAARHAAARHPALAAGVLVGYWIVLGAVRFAGSVAAKVAEMERDRLAGHIDGALVRRLSGFRRRYLAYVLASQRFIDQKGLPTVGFYTPELDEVFVDVTLVRRAPHETSADPLAELPVEVTERVSLSSLIEPAEPSLLALTGAPGSGKTTLLRHTARHIAATRRGLRRRVPIMLYLRDHAAAIVRGDDGGLPGLVRGQLGRYGPEPDGWLAARLRAGDCVVLLDGLDEVARTQDRRAVSAWVERQVAQYPLNDFVVTSRPAGYRSAPVQGATVLQALSFTDKQVERFVRAWYQAVERRSTGTSGADMRMLADSGADDLLARLRATPALQELTVNPLLLTMIANVHRFRNALPGSRADLYRDICEVMLWRRDEAKRLPPELGGEHNEMILRPIAFGMMRDRVRDLSRAGLIARIAAELPRFSASVSAAEYLDHVASCGMLVERESGSFSFAHQTFQEYLAAVHIREHGLAPVLAEAVDDPWWGEATLLYMARGDADPILEACFASGTVTALTLALDSADQPVSLAPALRERLAALLSAATAPDADPARRRLVTQVILTRALRRVLPAAGGYVCAQPVTAGSYELFIRDQQAAGYSRAPDCPLPAAGEPVTGVRAEDAAAFAGWVNDLVGETTYRLPALAEARELAARSVPPFAGGSLWLAGPSDVAPVPWASSAAVERGITPAGMADACDRDLAAIVNWPLQLVLLRSVAAAVLIARSSGAGGEAGRLATHLAADLRFQVERFASPGAGRTRPRASRDRKASQAETAAAVAALASSDADPAVGNIAHAIRMAELLASDFTAAGPDHLTRELRRAAWATAHALAEALAAVATGMRIPPGSYPVTASDGSGWRAPRVASLVRQATGPDLGAAAEVVIRLTTGALPGASHPGGGSVLASLSDQVLGRSQASAIDLAAVELPHDARALLLAQVRGREASLEGVADAYQLSMSAAHKDKPSARALAECLPAWETMWAREACGLLERAVAPVLARRARVTRPVVSKIRLAALSLASEASASVARPDDAPSVLLFRGIADAITCLEARLLGGREPDEQLVLALNGPVG